MYGEIKKKRERKCFDLFSPNSKQTGLILKKPLSSTLCHIKKTEKKPGDCQIHFKIERKSVLHVVKT